MATVIQVTVNPLAAPIVATATPVVYGVELKANLTNSGTVYVSPDAALTAGAGWALDPGESRLISPAMLTQMGLPHDAAQIYAITRPGDGGQTLSVWVT